MAGKIVGVRGGGKRHSGLYFVHFPDGEISTGQENLQILAGQPVPVGPDEKHRSKIHLDIDPMDEDGQEVPPGDPRLAGFYVDSFQRGSAEGDLNQTGDEKDHGCTPVFKCGGEGTLEVECWAMVNGQKVGDSIMLATINIR